jgi:enoyl-CoA hydratase
MQIRLEDHSPTVAIITLDNPARRNAMSRAMMADLADTWDKLSHTNHRCVVLTGEGDRAFTSGADLSGDMTASEETANIVNRSLLKYGGFHKPIVAAINGDCVAGGVELMLSTDIRAASSTARFGLPEVKWGIYPFGGATMKLSRQIGHVHAMELLYTGKLIDAQKAQAIGLVAHVLPPDQLMDWALTTAEVVAANSPVAVQAVKEQLMGTESATNQPREASEQALGERVRNSDDFREGVSAFLEKRTPNYR